ncbi:MAG: hypothetical protein KZQ57_13010 [gamma proteobacterium symbiont of Lucinoma myriamae]|nr:hypothetical protein [gamma proteobacterium symbiont of Lucinoma myriamae]
MADIMLKNNLKKQFNNKIPLILLIFFCFVLPANVFSESSFRVFQTQQPAQELIPSIAPLYADQAKFTAKNNSLIVKASPPVLNEIEQLLEELDKPLHNLLIEVSSSLEGDSHYQQDNVEGRIKMGDDVVIRSLAPDTDNPNITVRYGKNGSVIKSTHTRRNNSQSNPDTYRVRTLEGNWAFIQTGQKVPYYTSEQSNLRSGARHYYPRVQNTVELVDVTSGFEVFPTLNGEQVTLKIRPKHQSMNRQYPERINTRSVDTTVTGQLGQWIFLGGAINKVNEQNSATFHSTKRQSELNTNYRIRVNIIK